MRTKPLVWMCLLAALPFSTQAAPVDAKANDARLDAIGRAPSAQRIEADIRKLVSFGTRHTLSDTASDTRGIGAATRWIFDEFTRISKDCDGCLEVRYVRGTVKAGEPRIPRDTEISNVIAIQRGIDNGAGEALLRQHARGFQGAGDAAGVVVGAGGITRRIHHIGDA